MKNDVRLGEWRICDWQEAEFCIIGTFVDGKEEGPWISYYDSGQKERENTWEKGVQVGSTCWDINGSLVNCE